MATLGPEGSPEADDARHSIPADGFILMKDAALGQRVSAMREANIPLASIGGFAFFKENIVDNPNIMATLKSWLQCESFGLGLYRTLGSVPGAYSFRRSNPDLPVESVVVHLLEKESKIAIWKASHRVRVPFFKGKIGLWQATHSDLESAGLQRVEEIFENGGFCIRDTRVWMEVLNGRAITFAIAKKDVLERWEPMKLDGLLRPTVEEIQTPTFEIHVRYDDI